MVSVPARARFFGLMVVDTRRNYVDNELIGKGTYHYTNGTIYSGWYKDGDLIGVGTLMKDGIAYVGTVDNNRMFNGKSKEGLIKKKIREKL